METTTLKQTELSFINSESNEGKISFTTAEEFELNRPLKLNQGIQTSAVTVEGSGSFNVITEFSEVSASDFKFKDDSTGVLTITAPSSVTSHTLTLPSATGSANTVLQTDGSGNLSWTLLIPPGLIFPYGGTSAPTGFIICHGSAVSRTTYSALFAVIGTSFGTGDGSSTFNVPDFRGRFLRGVDGGVGRDPDRASRSGGDNIGSTQGHQLASHTHTYYDGHRYSEHQADDPDFLSGTRAANYGWGATTRTSDATGGNETRPININVHYIIKF